MAEVKLEQQETQTGWEPHIKEEPESPHIKEEPEEFPFHIITVKTEEDQDEASVLRQREETNADDSDTDRSEDYSQEQAPKNKRSYAMIPPDSCVTDHKKFSCSDCGKMFSSNVSLKTHMVVHTKARPFECTVCGRHFKLKHSLFRHLKAVHQNHVPKLARPFSCSDCGKRFRFKSDLRRHESSVHRGERPHKCTVCEKSFTEKKSLNVHMRTHTGEKPFICPVCTTGFVTKSALSQHQRRVHHICRVCSERFSDRNSLKEHLKGHVEEGTLDPSALLDRRAARPFSYSECGKTFSSRTHLKENPLVCKEDCLHRCSVCEKGFPLKGWLKEHMKTHKVLFICCVCERSFVQKSSHIRHQSLVHLICPVCFLHFPDKVRFSEHLKGHEEERTLEPSSALFKEIVRAFS